MTYETWIRKTQKDLQESIREAENNEWHHHGFETPTGAIYNRLLTWEAEIDEAVRRVNSKRRQGSRSRHEVD